MSEIKMRARKNDLAIRIKTGEYIGVNKTIIRALEYPKHLTFWWGSDNNVLGIATADEPIEMSVFVPAYFYKSRKGSKIMNWRLLKRIQSFTGWADQSIHLLTGEFIPELRMVVFRLGE